MDISSFGMARITKIVDYIIKLKNLLTPLISNYLHTVVTHFKNTHLMLVNFLLLAYYMKEEVNL